MDGPAAVRRWALFDLSATLAGIVLHGTTWYSRTFSTDGMPRLATALKTSASDFGDVPVRSLTSFRKALSLGMNAVSRTLPLPRTPTAEFGFAVSTALTAAVRMSKSLPLVSEPVPLARRTETRDFGPSLWWWLAAGEPEAAGEAWAAFAAGAAR